MYLHPLTYRYLRRLVRACGASLRPEMFRLGTHPMDAYSHRIPAQPTDV